METLEIIERELSSDEGGFYSSLDADSEGEEGKFYIWTEEELRNTLGDKANLVIDYYNVKKKGNWDTPRHTPSHHFGGGLIPEQVCNHFKYEP